MKVFPKIGVEIVPESLAKQDGYGRLPSFGVWHHLSVGSEKWLKDVQTWIDDIKEKVEQSQGARRPK